MGFSREEEDSNREGHLPEHELNPMMNPKLGQNLGRWAQVYFTAPPEKRKEAVEELLRELESEDPDYVPPAIVTKTVACPSCGERNEPAHRFCGMCGAELNGTVPAAPSNGQGHSQYATEREPATPPPVQEHEAFRPVAPPPMVERRIAPLPIEVERRIYKPGSSAPSAIARDEIRQAAQSAPVENHPPRETYRPTPAPLERQEVREVYRPVPSPPEPDPDVEWLRERTLVGLSDDEPKGSGLGKYIFIALLAIAGAFAGVEYLSRTPPKTVQVVEGEKPKTDSTPPQVNQEAPAPSAAEAQPTPEPKPPTKTEQPAVTEKTATQAAEKTTAQEKIPASATARIQRTSTVPSRPTAESAALDAEMSGNQELTMAQGYLQGRYGNSRNTSEAARWLWKSVAKQNTTASILLANLYMQGDGVSKSCDQARLLLVAAAKKGSSAAAQSLRNLENGGCK